MDKKIEVVEEILESLGAGDKKKIYVFNKIDNLQMAEEEKEAHLSMIKAHYEEFKPQFISALDRKSLSDLVAVVEKTIV